MKCKFCLILILLISIVIGKTPKELVVHSHNNIKNKKWSELGEYYDKESLKEFRIKFAFLFNMQDKSLRKKIMANFFGSKVSEEQIKKMDDKTFFKSIYGGLMKSASVFGQVHFDSLQVIGSIAENDTLEHVLTRKYITIRKIEIKELEVVTFIKQNGQWKMILSDKIKGLPTQIKSSLGL